MGIEYEYDWRNERWEVYCSVVLRIRPTIRVVSQIYSARTIEKVSANEKRYDIIAKMVKQVLLGSFCRYRKALYFWSLGISLYLELFCFLSFITIVLRNLCSGTHRRNLLLVAWQNSQTSKTSWRVTAMLLTLWCEHKIKRKIIVTA